MTTPKNIGTSQNFNKNSLKFRFPKMVPKIKLVEFRSESTTLRNSDQNSDVESDSDVFSDPSESEPEFGICN